jgi:hypothetical protein
MTDCSKLPLLTASFGLLFLLSENRLFRLPTGVHRDCSDPVAYVRVSSAEEAVFAVVSCEKELQDRDDALF